MNKYWIYLAFFILSYLNKTAGMGTLWTEWWTYSGVSGQNYWGIHNSEWSICNNGKYQSPINIEPKQIIHDPHLTKLNISNHKVDGLFVNNGQDLSFKINNASLNPITIFGGPLSYKYTLYDITLHYGEHDDKGSEHSIGGQKFPLEIQLYGYNGEINSNSSQASKAPHGIAAISVLAQVTDTENDNVNVLIQAALKVHLKGMTTVVNEFFPSTIMPSTDSFITYEGSLTRPGCMETVTWIILNKPIHISHRQIGLLRSLTYQDGSGQTLMENNFRDLQPSHGRLIRTNIRPKAKVNDCFNIKLTSYEGNATMKRTVFHRK